MRHRRPLGLLYIPPAAGEPLARLTALEGLSRAVMVGSVPLVALQALETKQAVSVVFFIGSALTVLVTVNVATLERLIKRRWVLTSGLVAAFVAAALFAFGPDWSIPLAIGLRSAEASMFSVCLSLYIMDFVEKAELTQAETRRSIYLAVAWIVGPTLGTYLWSNVGEPTPFLLSMILSVGVIVYHWYLRLERQNPVLLTPQQAATSPLRSIPRFAQQRNMRVAYAITCIRSIFWAALFIYGPIYVVEAGLSEWAAGVFLSVASGVLFLGPIVQRLAEAFGVRRVVTNAFGLMAASMVALAIVGDARPIGIAFWLTGAVGGGVIDVLGNIPFMRLVKRRERAPMTTVFSTWREVSFLVTPGIAALVLVALPFRAFYVVLAVLMLAGMATTSYLPRRL